MESLKKTAQGRETSSLRWQRKVVGGPSNIFYHGGILVDGYFYSFGGRTRKGDDEFLLDSANCLDVEKSKRSIPTMPTAFHRLPPCPIHTSCSTPLSFSDKRIFLFGGSADSNNTDYIYHADKRQWTKITYKDYTALDRYGHTAVQVGTDTVIIFGGASRDQIKRNDLLRFHVGQSNDETIVSCETLEPKTPSPSPRSFHTAVLLKDKMYLFGGVDRTGNQLNDLYVLDLESLTWSKPATRGSAPSPRCSHSCVVYGQYLCIFGGLGTDDLLNDLHIFDTENNYWSRIDVAGDVPAPRKGHCAAVHGTEMFISGGYTPSGSVSNAFYWLDLETLVKQLEGPIAASESDAETNQEMEKLTQEIEELKQALKTQMTETIRMRQFMLRIKTEAQVINEQWGTQTQLSPQDSRLLFQKVSLIGKLAEAASLPEVNRNSNEKRSLPNKPTLAKQLSESKLDFQRRSNRPAHSPKRVESEDQMSRSEGFEERPREEPANEEERQTHKEEQTQTVDEKEKQAETQDGTKEEESNSNVTIADNTQGTEVPQQQEVREDTIDQHISATNDEQKLESLSSSVEEKKEHVDSKDEEPQQEVVEEKIEQQPSKIEENVSKEDEVTCIEADQAQPTMAVIRDEGQPQEEPPQHQEATQEEIIFERSDEPNESMEPQQTEAPREEEIKPSEPKPEASIWVSHTTASSQEPEQPAVLPAQDTEKEQAVQPTEEHTEEGRDATSEGQKIERPTESESKDYVVNPATSAVDPSTPQQQEGVVEKVRPERPTLSRTGQQQFLALKRQMRAQTDSQLPSLKPMTSKSSDSLSLGTKPPVPSRPKGGLPPTPTPTSPISIPIPIPTTPTAAQTDSPKSSNSNKRPPVPAYPKPPLPTSPLPLRPDERNSPIKSGTPPPSRPPPATPTGEGSPSSSLPHHHQHHHHHHHLPPPVAPPNPTTTPTSTIAQRSWTVRDRVTQFKEQIPPKSPNSTTTAATNSNSPARTISSEDSNNNNNNSGSSPREELDSPKQPQRRHKTSSMGLSMPMREPPLPPPPSSTGNNNNNNNNNNSNNGLTIHSPTRINRSISEELVSSSSSPSLSTTPPDSPPSFEFLRLKNHTNTPTPSPPLSPTSTTTSFVSSTPASPLTTTSNNTAGSPGNAATGTTSLSKRIPGRHLTMFRKKRSETEMLPDDKDNRRASSPNIITGSITPIDDTFFISTPPTPTPTSTSISTSFTSSLFLMNEGEGSTPKALPCDIEVKDPVFQELIATEQTYVADLEVIIKLFKQNATFARMLSGADMQAIFAFIEPILQVNKMLLQQFLKVASMEPEEQNLGTVFIEMIPCFKVYNDYCANHSRATKTLIRLRKSEPALQEYLEAMRAHPQCKFLDLESMLIKPLQRVCRYPLLLKEYIKRVPKEHPSYSDLLIAEQRLTEFLDSLNQRKRENETLDELFELASSFIWDGKPAVKLVKPGRKLLYRGPLKKVDIEAGKVMTKVHMFLFTDLLLLAKEKGKKFSYLLHVPINSCLIYSQDKAAFGFTLARLDCKQKLGIYLQSDEEREGWVNAITDSMSHSMTNQRSRGATTGPVVQFSNE